MSLQAVACSEQHLVACTLNHSELNGAVARDINALRLVHNKRSPNSFLFNVGISQLLGFTPA